MQFRCLYVAVAGLLMAAAGEMAAEEDAVDDADEDGDNAVFFQSERALKFGHVEFHGLEDSLGDLLDDFDVSGDPFSRRSNRGRQPGAANLVLSNLVRQFGNNRLSLLFCILVFGVGAVVNGFWYWKSLPAREPARDARRVVDAGAKGKTTAERGELTQAIAKNAKSLDGPFGEAIRAGDEALCAALLQDKTTILQRDVCGCSALHLAAHCGQARVVEMLLERNADANAREAWEETPLHTAARAGRADICQLLLLHGADIDAPNSDDMTPLVVAAHAKAEDACETLLDNGAGAGGLPDTEMPPLLTALLIQQMFKGVGSRSPIDDASAQSSKCQDALPSPVPSPARASV